MTEHHTSFDTFLSESRHTLDQCIQILGKKNHDYAESADPFLNFRTAAETAGIAPKQVVLALLGMKLSRIHQLIGEGKTALNESTEDSLVDIINYALLLRGLLHEEQETERL